MFGLRKMRQQRDNLYAQTKALEDMAKAHREHFISQTIHQMASPKGLLVSFLAGTATQCSIPNQHKQRLIAGTQHEVISLLFQQLGAWMNRDATSSRGSTSQHDVES